MLSSSFDILMKLVFESILQKVAELSAVEQEMQKYVYVCGTRSARKHDCGRLAYMIVDAIRRNKRIKIDYVRSNGERSTGREVEAYGIINRHDVWYAVCKDIKSQEMRLFRIDQIERVAVVENSFYRIPETFSLKEEYGSSWGLWTGEDVKKEIIRLQVCADVAVKFYSTQYHESQSCKEIGDGELEVSFEVTGATAMIPWLMSWGPTIEVLEPEWLRQAVRENAVSIAEMYN